MRECESNLINYSNKFRKVFKIRVLGIILMILLHIKHSLVMTVIILALEYGVMPTSDRYLRL
jgi:hypothetical protein